MQDPENDVYRKAVEMTKKVGKSVKINCTLTAVKKAIASSKHFGVNKQLCGLPLQAPELHAQLHAQMRAQQEEEVMVAAGSSMPL